MKKIVSAVLVFVMMLSLAGCGISYDDIKGDWTAKTINGMTIDEYAASLGVDPSQATVNVNITEDDIPDDIKELIEMGLYSEEEAEKKIAVGNGNRERRMIIVKPDITYVGTGDDRKPTVAFEDGKYDEDDLYFYACLSRHYLMLVQNQVQIMIQIQRVRKLHQKMMTFLQCLKV